jgi:peptide chain release factor subunit 3
MPHLNVVFMGHVDAGKSTTCGNILRLCGRVDERIIEKFTKEAIENHRDSWFLAYIMDTGEEEKARGKTVEVGRAAFETSNRRFTILDAPGHRSFIPNMISGASQADIGVLIISARVNEFESGFEGGGQTREHALLAKTLGVDRLIVAVNKMDDPSVNWKQDRFNIIVDKMKPFLKTLNFKEVVYLPMSGLTGDNLKERKNTPSWFVGKSLLDELDTLDPPERRNDLPLRIPMLDAFKDRGNITAIGKIVQGTVNPGQRVLIMPGRRSCTVSAIYINEVEVLTASCGENITMTMGGDISEEDLRQGFIMTDTIQAVRVVKKFKAQMKIIALPRQLVMTAGYKAILHIHTATEECEILKLYTCQVARTGDVITCSILLGRLTPVDVYAGGVQQLGRFTLRDEGITVAIGIITELPILF